MGFKNKFIVLQSVLEVFLNRTETKNTFFLNNRKSQNIKKILTQGIF